MEAGAQRGDEYPADLAARYGSIRNLADFVRKAQLANYEAFRAMYEGRNVDMFTKTTGVLTWMSHPAQPSFVWQLYHYDLEPNASLYGVQKASEMVHVQFNEAMREIEVVNNLPQTLHGLTLKQTVYSFDCKKADKQRVIDIDDLPASATKKLYTIEVNSRISKIYFLKFDLLDAAGRLLSTNFYWQNVAQDDFAGLMKLRTVTLDASADSTLQADNTLIHVRLTNPSPNIALMTHLQLHRKSDGQRVLPSFASENYISLVPGESREVVIQAATKDLPGGPVVYLDGYNVSVKSSSQGSVEIKPNENADPLHWPPSKIVP
jgi:beta-mannosidase